MHLWSFDEVLQDIEIITQFRVMIEKDSLAQKVLEAKGYDLRLCRFFELFTEVNKDLKGLGPNFTEIMINQFLDDDSNIIYPCDVEPTDEFNYHVYRIEFINRKIFGLMRLMGKYNDKEQTITHLDNGDPNIKYIAIVHMKQKIVAYLDRRTG